MKTGSFFFTYAYCFIMRPHPHVPTTFKQELSDWHMWAGRGVVITFAALAGLTVVVFTWLADHAIAQFFLFQNAYWWGPLFWTPLSTSAIVWLTLRFAPGAAGSGIPQVMAALEPQAMGTVRRLYVSLKLSIAKILLTTWGLLAGLSLGREGPSVQIAAGVMHYARRWLPKRAHIGEHSLLIAGGAAGIAAAFNTPLGGVMFAIEELSKRAEQRSNSLILVAIVLGGLMGVSAYGNASYFGVIHIENFGFALILPAILVALCCGVAGGLFSRLLIVSLSGSSMDRFSQFRKTSPVLFAAGCGLAVAILGVVSHGETYGSGYAHNRAMLENTNDTSSLYVLLKFVATWLTTWAGVPAGVFAPSLAIGGALGNDLAQLTAYANAPTLIALGMAAFLAAVTQAPLTSFIIVMEMVDGHALVLSLMACTLVASGASKLISAPLYSSLAELQLLRIKSLVDTPKKNV
ncbi:H(+)/Cl(-) exchange transporter ClcA [Rhodoferax lithotrophicus]|uniref:H(+)/Cl(-) exchange transporter ClcA n=2 Tax=Rhodoferax lithotrophicus TaxID=2798804 RepID=A0ABM7MSJ5_9BURK|nr:H(+)/Cl(-) exchange transporter ClcA [Rhodoferax sp. MIZ03]